MGRVGRMVLGAHGAHVTLTDDDVRAIGAAQRLLVGSDAVFACAVCGQRFELDDDGYVLDCCVADLGCLKCASAYRTALGCDLDDSDIQFAWAGWVAWCQQRSTRTLAEVMCAGHAG